MTIFAISIPLDAQIQYWYNDWIKIIEITWMMLLGTPVLNKIMQMYGLIRVQSKNVSNHWIAVRGAWP